MESETLLFSRALLKILQYLGPLPHKGLSTRVVLGVYLLLLLIENGGLQEEQHSEAGTTVYPCPPWSSSGTHCTTLLSYSSTAMETKLQTANPDL